MVRFQILIWAMGLLGTSLALGCAGTEAPVKAAESSGAKPGDREWQPGANTPMRFVGDIPVKSTELFAWLQAGSYKEFEAEAEKHTSNSPHPPGRNPVRVFFSPKMAEAMREGAESMPIGAGAVKEMWSNDGTLVGWAVEVKTDEGRGGDSWYWYEVVSTETDDGNVFGGGNGVMGCVGCHAQGDDYVISRL